MRLPCRRLVALVALSVLLLVSCGDDSGSGVTVRSFDEVRASDLTFEVDPSDPSRGIFRVTTSEPMICAIVWGTDDSFGRFNNSLSMNGTGLEQHDVALPDVEPGVTYTYIVQGTTADGTLYRSEPATFRLDVATAPAVSTTTPGRNVATSASVVQVSSEFSAAFAGAKAVDGDTATEWASRGDGDNGSISLDLGATVDIAGVEFVTRSMADGSAVTSTYTVTVEGVATAFGPFPAGTLAVPRPATIAARGRVVRFDVEASSGGNVGAVEIRVFVA